MNRIVKKIIIVSFLICFFCMNTIIAAPYLYRPKKYDITINNINKINIEKVEVLIDYGAKGKYKVIDTIDNKDIKQKVNGINIVLTDVDNAIYLRFCMKSGKEIITNEIDYSSAMMVDEFSARDERYVAEAKKSAEKTAYFTGTYNLSNANIEIKDSNWIVSIVTNLPIPIVILICIVIALVIVRVRKMKDNKQTKNLE